MITRIELVSVDTPDVTKIFSVWRFGGDEGMQIEQTNKSAHAKKNDTVTIIKHENWHKYEVNGIPLVLLIDRKMSEVPPT